MDKPEFAPPKLPDEKRRNLVRGGLAAPIVLGTLVSKQALGGGASYGCSVSGKWSGGSSHGTTTPDCHVGKSCEEVQTACKNGGHPYIKGSCVKNYTGGDKVYWDGNNDAKMYLCGVTMGQLFGNNNSRCYRKYKSSSYGGGGHWEMCDSSASGRIEMSCYEGLFLDNTCNDPKGSQHADLCREAVCAYYNAQNYQTLGYPCNTTQVIGMANDCFSYGKVYLSKYFAVSDTAAYWTTDECIAFFKGCRRSDHYS